MSSLSTYKPINQIIVTVFLWLFNHNTSVSSFSWLFLHQGPISSYCLKGHILSIPHFLFLMSSINFSHSLLFHIRQEEQLFLHVQFLLLYSCLCSHTFWTLEEQHSSSSCGPPAGRVLRWWQLIIQSTVPAAAVGLIDTIGSHPHLPPFSFLNSIHLHLSPQKFWGWPVVV